MDGPVLTSEIECVDGRTEAMMFELFSPAEIEQRAARFGFRTVETCCWWDRDRPPTFDEQHFQITFDRL